MKILNIIFTFILLLEIAVPGLVLAQLDNQLIPPSGPELDFKRVELLMRRTGFWLITVSILLAVIVIVWGGISYMLSGGNEAKTTKAVKKIRDGLIGVAIVLFAGLALNTLSAVFVQTFFGV